MKRILLVAAIACSLFLFSAAGQATVVTSMPGGTVVSMPGVDYTGTGPQTVIPGITWTSNNPDSLFGYPGSYAFGDNGLWDGGLGPMAGVQGSYYDSDPPFHSTMTFAFSTPVAGVGGFINYYTPITTPDGGSTPTMIAVYDSTMTLIESAILNFATDGSNNSGFFYGFLENTPKISYFTLTDNYVGITSLTVAENAVPLPGAFWLLGSGLLGLIGVRRRIHG